MNKSLAGFLLVAVMCAADIRAVQLQTLWSFANGPGGATPGARLVQGSDGALYGTTQGGGTNFAGTVFKITTNGVLPSLWSFTGGNDGTTPSGGLVQAGDGAFYGMNSQGGSNSVGLIYRITTNGTLTTAWTFGNGEGGYYPEAELVKASDGALYETCRSGNVVNNAGTIFKMTTNGVATGLWAFTLGPDGGRPQVGLVQGGNGALYGSAYDGGTNNLGTLFKITTNGTMTPLWSFKGSDDIGGRADAELVKANDGSLYGTATIGRTNGWGTIFRLVLDSLPPTGYDAWAAGITNGVTNYNQSATGDGYPNLLKYFTGSSPTTTDTLARLTATPTEPARSRRADSSREFTEHRAHGFHGERRLTG